MIDWTKPVQSKNGRKAEVLDHNFLSEDWGIRTLVKLVPPENSKYPAHELRQVNAFGEYPDRKYSEYDIINVPETRVVWVNMYPSGYASAADSKDGADEQASRDRHACIRVEYTVGQFNEEPDNGK